MADEKERTDIIIEGNTATWELRADGDINGTYTGSFRFRCFLSPTQQLAAGREHRELLGKNPTLASSDDDTIAWFLSELKQRVITAPPFWTAGGYPGDIPDLNILSAVMDAASAAQQKYKNQLKNRKDDAIKRAKEMAEKMVATRDAAPDKDKEDESES